MMATTHAFAGLAVVAPAAVLAPELATPLAAGAIAGGIAPDLDMVGGVTHRRTLHFPVLTGLVAVPALVVAVLFTVPGTAVLAAFTVAAWLHAASDAIGGGPELEPWKTRSDRGVYDHARGRWIRPRRWIRYDGAPEDAALAVALAVPAALVFPRWVRAVVAVGLAISICYALLRRRIPRWTPEWLQ